MSADTLAQATSRKLKVLAADDNAANRLMLKSAFDLFGLSAVVVADGQAAVDAWAVTGFDIILLDIEMPGLDGPTALEAIRQAERAGGLPRTPAIAFSGHDSAHLARNHRDHGFDLHVAKPVALSQLRDALDTAGALREMAGPFQNLRRRDVV